MRFKAVLKAVDSSNNESTLEITFKVKDNVNPTIEKAKIEYSYDGKNVAEIEENEITNNNHPKQI